jgi:hypothetical protein
MYGCKNPCIRLFHVHLSFEWTASSICRDSARVTHQLAVPAASTEQPENTEGEGSEDAESKTGNRTRRTGEPTGTNC